MAAYIQEKIQDNLGGFKEKRLGVRSCAPANILCYLYSKIREKILEK